MTDSDTELTTDEQRTDREPRDRDGAASGGPAERWDGRPTPNPSRSLETLPADADAAGEADDGFGGIERRDYLKALGAAGAVGSLAGATSGTAAAQEDWEAAADDRIEEHRTADLEVTVEDTAGNPVSDAEVEVEMQQHDFGFGTAVHAEFLTSGTEWGEELPEFDEEDEQQYADTIEELFNEIVLENYHKWNIWETDWENPDETAGNDPADDAVDWAVERGMDVRGHVCLWGDVGAYAVPPDVAEAMGVDPNSTDFSHDDFQEANHDPELIRERSMGQIERIIDYYGDDIKEWEVVNEVLHKQQMIRAAEGNGPNDQSVDPPTAEILGDWYEHAQEVADEHDVGIAVNDYNTMAGAYGNTRDSYETQVDYLVNERGVDLDGVGFQCHFNTHERVSSDDIMSNLDRFAQYDVGLRTTEFDMFQGNWTEQQQADYIYEYLKTFFSHPEAEDFLVWGHWTPLHWGDDYGGASQDAPFYREDWTEKPALEEYRSLVFDEWWTSESGSTDDSGTYTTSAFLGEHELTVTAGGESVTETVSVTDAGEPVELTVVAGEAEESCPDAAASETLEDGSTVCDVDGDGEYRDVTGDGSVTNSDVTEFFGNQHVDPWDSRTDLFDFTGDDDVTQADVIELFSTIN